MADQNKSDELNWKLGGIRSERTALQARLTYLDEMERSLTNVGLTGRNGAKTAAKHTPVTQKKRNRRKPDEATRQRMSEAAKARWAQLKGTNVAGAAGNAPTPAPPVETVQTT